MWTQTIARLAACAVFAGTLLNACGQSSPEEYACPVSDNIRGHENIEWSQAYAYHLTDGKRNLPRVLLVGDSICRDYEGGVRKLLDGRMNVSYWVSSYCVTSPTYMRLLSLYLDEAQYDVVHFNNGLHSLGTEAKDWEKGFLAALRLIRKKQPDAKIVWCTSTPLKDAAKTAKVKELNEVGAKVVAEIGGVATNDLFAFLDPLDREANWHDVFHHKKEICKKEAKQVADAVLAARGEKLSENPVSVSNAGDNGAGGCTLVEKRAKPLEWLFPTGDETPHEGMAFADGVTGVLAWGGGDTLKLTVSRADLWDHRGGYTWTDAQSYTNITDAILKGDEKRLLDLFKKKTPRGEPRNPFMLPLGRVEVKIPGATLKRGTLDVKTGLGEIEFDMGGKLCRAELAMSKQSRAFALKLPDGIEFEAKAIHAMEFPAVKEKLTPLGHKRAEYSDNGFTWELPADESVTLAFAKRGGELTVCTWRGKISRRDAEVQSSTSKFLCDSASLREISFAKVRAESEAYWAKFWREGARVKVPDPVVQGLFDYGMYRFGAMTDPDGVPAGLQGPWIEDNALPPWSGDYHFNINVQECYSPAYRGGHFANMMPLFRMICSWKPVLRENARKFAGVDGYVLPHSVSDRGVNIGGFWTGTIDHGSNAWVADMMWRYVKYSRDVDFLRREAYDYMKGAMNVYRAMMEEDGNGKLAFPTGPSPEWGGSHFDTAVGRNPSFQLAAVHRLARNLIAAAQMLGEKPDAMWLDVENRLPLASIDDAQGGILLFENRPLSESHRHHSHMAGLFPFDIFDLSDAATAATVEKTYAHWRAKGTSQWTGWCVPWAAVLETHLGNAATAVELLRKWDEYFTNPGHAARCYPWKPGFCSGGKYRIGKDGRPLPTSQPKKHEVVEMDGQCAFAAAVLEMMAHEVNGKTEFFRGCPPEWKDVSFENIALSDGRRASGRRLDGKATVKFIAHSPADR